MHVLYIHTCTDVGRNAGERHIEAGLIHTYKYTYIITRTPGVGGNAREQTEGRIHAYTYTCIHTRMGVGVHAKEQIEARYIHAYT